MRLSKALLCSTYNYNMRLPKDFLFHTLRGIDGWSDLKLSTVDVARVLDISCEKRQTRILDVQYPYKLTITYDILDHVNCVKCGFYGTKYVTKRYRSKSECQEDIDAIKIKQLKLKKFVDSLNLHKE